MAVGIHSGHRYRMRNKLIRFGSEIFTDHELLEMLLFSVIPYKNTNPIAINLLKRFSGLEGVFSASREELTQVDGIGERAAEMIFAVGRMTLDETPLRDTAGSVKSFDDYSDAGKFLVDYFDGSAGYKTVLLLLNNSMEFLDIVNMTETDYCYAAVKARDFLNAAMSRNASVCIVAHNHPYGPLFPTSSDSATNSLIENALAKIGVLMIEHYVFSGKSYVGIMTNLKSAFSQKPEVSKFLESKRRQI